MSWLDRSPRGDPTPATPREAPMAITPSAKADRNFRLPMAERTPTRKKGAPKGAKSPLSADCSKG